MHNENINNLNLEDMPSISDNQLDELLAEATALSSDMPDLGATVTTATLPRRRDRASEKEKKLRRNARKFYRIYFAATAILLCLLLILMIPLRNWLERFETTQPDHHSQKVFNELFAQADWGKVYDAAKLDSELGTKDGFIQYMQAKVDAAQNKEITFYETSAGLSKDHKYIVLLGDEKIATFTLTGTVNEKTQKTEWTMNSLQLALDFSQSISIQRLPGYTVFVNGEALSDDHVVRTISTKAEDYLPEGTHGYMLEELRVDGLMGNPAVEVKDAQGNIVPIVFNEETSCYQLNLPVPEMTAAEQDIILGAAKANALFAIRATGTGELSKYFDATTQIYQDICSTPTFIQSFASYSFNESVTAVSDFYRYGDNLFSARVTLQLDVTRKNGTVKSLEMNTTYIFTKNAAGTFMVTDITNVNLQEQVQQVRVQFECNGTTLTSTMVDSTANTITLPQPDVQPGQKFLGWASKSVADNGQVTMTILFAPGETGHIASDLKLEPMTLYAVFEAEGAVQ